MKKINVLGALAAPLMLFFLTSAGRADDAAAPTTCKDGTTSTATGRGACSGHGGVQKAAKAAPAATPAPAAVSATAKCKDGTYSKSKVHTGSCSHHGGVAQFLTPGQ